MTGTAHPPHDLIIRKALPDDAPRLIQYVHRITEECPDTLPLAPGEFTMTVEQERQFLTDVMALDNSVFLLAESNGALAGVLNCDGNKRKATRHAVTLGMSVRRAWQGQGIGKALMQAAIDWANGTGVVRRIELSVYADNLRAIALYRNFGFVEEGKRQRAVLRDGIYIDDLIMALLL